MYSKMSFAELETYHRNDNVEFKHLKMNDEKDELIVNTKGELYRKMKSGNWKQIANKNNHAKGYNVILISKKQYMRSKIVMHAFKGLDLHEKYINICHVNKDRLNCELSNLVLK
jgi:hypothetical protein